MTIDERFEENARTAQFLTLQKSHDDQIAALIERDVALSAKMDILTDRTMQAMDSINRLGRIAASHGERLDDLEGRNEA